ncbi:MAG: hypothetical protein IKT33_00190 [Clostridia bacterium]|nr:hypothetical protein [Clostridia bacterium]
MIVCDIVKVLEYNNYEIKSGNKSYHVMFEFYNVKKPDVGDRILIHEKLLDINWSGYTQPYAFELDKVLLPKHVMLNDDREYIVLGTGGKNFVMKRVYG